MRLRRIAGLAGVNAGRLDVALVCDRRMASLHRRYKGVPGTTDVLTFNLRDDPEADPSAGPIEGDLILCVPEARRQAARRGHDIRLELLLYAVHGLLHLLGYDDHSAAKSRRMHAREDELLVLSGLPPVYQQGLE